MLLTSLILTLSPSLAPAPTAASLPEDRRAEVQARYAALAEKSDAAGLAKLWQENEDLVLGAISSDLEAGLALWEAAPKKPPTEAIEAHYKRALFGALAATEATGRPIFADYASAFIGWTAQQKRDYRDEQKIYARGLEVVAMDVPPWEPEAYQGIDLGRETRERAVALGDWWGVAQGYTLEGRGHQKLGQQEEAMVCHSTARLYYASLGLVVDELESLRALVDTLRALEAWPRAHTACGEALKLARELEARDQVLELLAARAKLERLLGGEEAAQRTEAELKALLDADADADAEK